MSGLKTDREDAGARTKGMDEGGGITGKNCDGCGVVCGERIFIIWAGRFRLCGGRFRLFNLVRSTTLDHHHQKAGKRRAIYPAGSSKATPRKRGGNAGNWYIWKRVKSAATRGAPAGLCTRKRSLHQLFLVVQRSCSVPLYALYLVCHGSSLCKLNRI